MSVLRALIRRPSIQKYTILLCVGYLLVVFVFHARLQFRAPPIAQDAEDVLSNDGIPKGALKTHRPHQSTVIRSVLGENVGAVVRTTRPANIIIRQQSTRKISPLRNRTQREGNPFRDEQRPCAGPLAEQENEFRIVAPGVYIYSAYWDDRENDFDNQYGGVKVRFMSTAIGKGHRPVVNCLWTVDGAERATLATYYEMCENHNRKWGGFILSCEVPSDIQARPRCSVRVSGAKNPGSALRTVVRIPLTQITPMPSRYTFGMCVPPLFGNVSSARLVEFVELSLMLGAEHIMVYNFRITPTVNQTLQHYVRQGIITVLPWTLPNTIDKAMWYHGQIVAVQDCLWRHMGRAEFLSFNDIDEFIIPHAGLTWTDVVQHIDSDTVCGFKFKSAFFNPRSAPLPPQAEGVKLLPSLMTSVNQRSSMLSHVRTKCMVKPRRVFEMGIHHISKPILASLGGASVEPTLAVLHHYRACLAGFGMVCRDVSQDDTVLRYSSTLYARMKKALKHIEGHAPGPSR